MQRRLLDREQQLGDHVPVDAAQTLVGEEGSGTAGEVAMREHLLVQGENPVTLDRGGHSEPRIGGQPIEDGGH